MKTIMMIQKEHANLEKKCTIISKETLKTIDAPFRFDSLERFQIQLGLMQSTPSNVMIWFYGSLKSERLIQ